MLSIFGRSTPPDAIKAARVGLGISQSQLAVGLRVSKQTVSNWETGRTEAPGYLGLALRWIIRMTTEGRDQLWPDHKIDVFEFRERHDLSQDLMARHLRVSPDTIRNWESGSTTAPEFLQLALAELEVILASKV